jgi:hypothetical protein
MSGPACGSRPLGLVISNLGKPFPALRFNENRPFQAVDGEHGANVPREELRDAINWVVGDHGQDVTQISSFAESRRWA